VVFCFDGDLAGRKAAWRALEVSLPLAVDSKKMRFLFLPDGEDPDSYVRRHGKDAFEKMVRESQVMSEFLVGELRSQADLGTAEGRSQFLVAARPHLQKIAAAGLRLQLVKEVARIGEVTQDEAESLLGVAESPAFHRAAPARREFRPPSTNEWKLLSSVAAFPSLAAEIDVTLINPSLDESRALSDLFAYCSSRLSGVDLSPAMMIEQFKDSPHADLMFHAQAFGLELGETEDRSRSYVRHTLRKLEIARRNREIKSLNERLNKDQLSREEHTQLAKMISEVKLLERQLQADARDGPAK